MCVRLKPYKESLQTHGNDYWCLPGGGLDEGEALLAGVEREMTEETGVRPVVGNLLFVQQFALGEQEFIEFFFHITNSEDYLQIDLAKTTHGEEEIEEISFVDPAMTHILPAFLTTENLEALAVGNKPTKIFSTIGKES